MFIAYGLLTGQAAQLDGKPRAHYGRFHLRDSLARMPADTWQHQFLAIWKLLSQLEMPNYRVFAWQDWQRAVEAVLQPQSQKSLLDFTRLA